MLLIFKMRSQVFSRISYYIIGEEASEWWTVTDLNRRQLRCKRSALPTELTAQSRDVIRLSPLTPHGYSNLLRTRVSSDIIQRQLVTSRAAPL